MDTANFLSLHKIKPSLIRIMVYDYVSLTKSHPTVEEIYSNLHDRAPTLSKTTVYNSVKLFADEGLFKIITIDGNQIRYDADISMHAHFQCTKCNKIYDFSLETRNENGIDDFDVQKREFFYSGICKACLGL